MPIVTDEGFRPTDAPALLGLDALAEATGDALAVLLPNDADPRALASWFDRLALVVTPFPGFADGRGFSIARRLRDLGYRGRLRAGGHLIADQYAYARACGFDEVEIDDALAARQPEPLWLAAAAAARRPDYRDRLARRP